MLDEGVHFVHGRGSGKMVRLGFDISCCVILDYRLELCTSIKNRTECIFDIDTT